MGKNMVLSSILSFCKFILLKTFCLLHTVHNKTLSQAPYYKTLQNIIEIVNTIVDKPNTFTQKHGSGVLFICM